MCYGINIPVLGDDAASAQTPARTRRKRVVLVLDYAAHLVAKRTASGSLRGGESSPVGQRQSG